MVQPFRVITRRVYCFEGRDIIVAKTPKGKKAFYRRTGQGRTRYARGAQPGMWAPFYGLMYGNWMVKPTFNGNPDLYRFGIPENKQISEWLSTKDIPQGEREFSWEEINKRLFQIGIIGKPVKLLDGNISFCVYDESHQFFEGIGV